MIEKIHIHICIVAALITTIVSILQKTTLANLAIRLIFVIIIFYIVGMIVKTYLKNKVFKPKDLDISKDDNGVNEITPLSTLENKEETM